MTSTPAVPLDVIDIDSDGDTSEYAPDLDLTNRVKGEDVDMGAYEREADCNDNGVPDDVDIAGGTSEDCNSNGIPDECEIADGAPHCNGVLDECRRCPVEVFFVLDTSGSMVAELPDICADVITPVNQYLLSQLDLDVTLRVLTLAGEGVSFGCIGEAPPSVNGFFSNGNPTPVPGDNGECIDTLPN